MSKKIGYMPFENPGNAYTERTKEILSNFGEVCSVPRLAELIKKPSLLKYKSYDCLVANWIDNCLVNKRGKISLFGLIKYFLGILLLRFLSKKTVFVRHNNYPHNAVGLSARIVSRVIDLSESLFDVAVTHSGHHALCNKVYVPHPLYKSVNSEGEGEGEGEIVGPYFLAFGRILPYKNLEKLIFGISPDVRVVIAGSAPDPSYIEKLRASAVGKKIDVIPEFISDERAAILARKSLGIVVSHHDKDMVVSGSFFYAISLGVPVFLVETPFAKWVDESLFISGVYVYKTIENLCSGLASYQTLGDDKEWEEGGELYFGDTVVKDGWAEVLGF